MSLDESDADMPFFENISEADLISNHSNSSVGGVGFGMTILNPNLGNGTLDHNSNRYGYNEERNWVVVGVLIALIVMLWLILGGMLCYPLMRYIRRKMPVSKRRINRRYETIEGWLITKVRKEDGDYYATNVSTLLSVLTAPSVLPLSGGSTS